MSWGVLASDTNLYPTVCSITVDASDIVGKSVFNTCRVTKIGPTVRRKCTGPSWGWEWSNNRLWSIKTDLRTTNPSITMCFLASFFPAPRAAFLLQKHLIAGGCGAFCQGSFLSTPKFPVAVWPSLRHISWINRAISLREMPSNLKTLITRGE